MNPFLLIGLPILGLAVGGVIVWALMKARTAAVQAKVRAEWEPQVVALTERAAARERQVADLQAALAKTEQQAAQTSARLQEESNARAAAEERTTAIPRLQSQLETRESQMLTIQAELTRLRELRSELETTLKDERKSTEEKLALLNHAQRALSDTFQALSAEALKNNNQTFLNLVQSALGTFQEAAKGDLERRQQTLQAIVEPLKQHLETYQQRLQQGETTQASLLGEVRKQLESLSLHSQSLSTETHQLRRILSSSPARGRWGEETLRRVVEAAGLSPHCDFTEQLHTGESKPDLVIHLPGDRLIIIDAKVPDFDVLTQAAPADDAKRAELLAAHAAKLRGTIKALADRDYPRQLPNAFDHVVLFLPAESLFSAALEGDPEMLLWASNRRILLATPASLIALLHAIALSWQQHAQAENAREIAAAAKELHARVATFFEHFERIRSGLDRAAAAYNDAVGSYERMVRPCGDKLVRLGGGADGRSLPEPQTASTTLRPSAEG